MGKSWGPSRTPCAQEGRAAAQHGDAQAKVAPGEADEDQCQDASRRAVDPTCVPLVVKAAMNRAYLGDSWDFS